MSDSRTLRCFVGNFEFEHRLALGTGWQPSQLLRRLNVEMAAAWLAIATDQDFILTEAPLPDEFLQQLSTAGLARPRCFTRQQLEKERRTLPADVQLVPWGWDAASLQLAKQLGLASQLPPLDVVRRVNARSFSWECERQLGATVRQAARLESVAAVAEQLRQLESDETGWVIKSEFGMSARERILGRGRRLEDSAVAWIDKRVHLGQPVFFEPWLEAVEEVGLQFQIEPHGEIWFLGGTRLWNNPSGQYRGSSFVSANRLEKEGRFVISASECQSDGRLDALLQTIEPERWRPAIASACRVAANAHELGYFGPLGIDAMCYRSHNGEGENGMTAWRPIQDSNARWTMGRLALGLAERLADGEVGAWLHVAWNKSGGSSAEDWLAGYRNHLDPRVRLVAMSPLQLADDPTRCGILYLAAPDAGLLEAAIAQL